MSVLTLALLSGVAILLTLTVIFSNMFLSRKGKAKEQEKLVKRGENDLASLKLTDLGNENDNGNAEIEKEQKK